MPGTPRSLKKRHFENGEPVSPNKRRKSTQSTPVSRAQEQLWTRQEEAELYNDIEGAHDSLASSVLEVKSFRNEDEEHSGKSSTKRTKRPRAVRPTKLSQLSVEEQADSGRRPKKPHFKGERTPAAARAKAAAENRSPVKEQYVSDTTQDDEISAIGRDMPEKNYTARIEETLLDTAVTATPSKRRGRPPKQRPWQHKDERPRQESISTPKSQKKTNARKSHGDLAAKANGFPHSKSEEVGGEGGNQENQHMKTPTSQRKKKIPRYLAQLADTPEYAKARTLRRTEYDELVDRNENEGPDRSKPRTAASSPSRVYDEPDIGVADLNVDTPSRRGRRRNDTTLPRDGIPDTEDEMTEDTRQSSTLEQHAEAQVFYDKKIYTNVPKLQLQAIPAKPSITKTKPRSIPVPRTCTTHFPIIKNIVLSKLTGKRPIPVTGLEEEYSNIHTLLYATVTAGESNSMLLIGARGSGKTALVNSALHELKEENGDDFHVVTLNGFIHTDDKLALRDIWRQLGREMEIDEDDTKGPGKSYADTLAMLLALLSHPDELGGNREKDGNSQSKVSRSVLFIMDEFDLFASHPRQTLLYNLLDIAQSRKAPIAVLGLTTRMDVTDALEKRVKSRFSHRYVHISLAKSMAAFNDIVKAALKLTAAELSFGEKAALLGPGTTQAPSKGTVSNASSVLAAWNAAIDDLFKLPSFLRGYMLPTYHISKSIPAVLSSLLLPISSLQPSSDLATHFTLPAHHSSTTPHPSLLSAPSSNLALLPSLSDLALSLLIASCRLEILHATPQLNFPLAYAEYVTLASKARLIASSSTPSATAANLSATRIFGKEVARREWERLLANGLLIPTIGAGEMAATKAAAGAGMVRVDVALEEIPRAVKLSATMERWCRQL